jgi:hypothetical protein
VRFISRPSVQLSISRWSIILSENQFPLFGIML